jgi:hypothetical protein
VSITYIDSVSGATKTIVDNGSGSLTGAVNGVNANSINYVTGAVSFSTASPIKANSLVIASYAEKAVETVHAERFGDSAKNYAVGVEGTFNDENWGRNQFTEVSALAADYKGIYAFNKVDDILQVNNVGVLKLLEKRDLPDGSRRHSLILRIKPDLLERQDFLSLLVTRLVHDTISALAQLFDLNIPIHDEHVCIPTHIVKSS